MLETFPSLLRCTRGLSTRTHSRTSAGVTRAKFYRRGKLHDPLLASGNSIRIVPCFEGGRRWKSVWRAAKVAEASCNKVVFMEAELISIEYKI